jgi:bifunctional aspartokinase / homoserine dehydrogenase 1
MNQPPVNTMSKPLRIMKFGGTSVGDASSIQKVVEIIRGAAPDSDLVVVVSAMSGVTNQLIEAATQAEAGDCTTFARIFDELRRRHDAVLKALILSADQRSRIAHEMDKLLREGERLCQDTMRLRELTARALDSISSLGERLSAPIVAAALAECGVASEAIEATELIQTDSCHGAADPRMDVTRRLCEARLRPLLGKDVVPVVTGFIGATAEGVLTTLGRGGSDYSASIVGAALDADEILIWTDVDGMMTADPRLVPGASTIPAISYRQAAELARFGAKVLHPKTLRAVMQCGTTLWIRNTFAPEQTGTKITPAGPANGGGVKGLSVISDVALITVGGAGIVGASDILQRTLATTAPVRAHVLLFSQSSSQSDTHVVLSSPLAKPTVEALRREFARDLKDEKVGHVSLDSTVAIVTVVGQNLKSSGMVERMFGALSREGVNILAIAHGSSEYNVSFVVSRDDMKTALVTAHREFRLDVLDPQALPAATSASRPPAWC